MIVPGWSGSGPEHWQSRWLNQLKTSRLVEQGDWYSPSRDEWVRRIVDAVAWSERPTLLVAHSVGCIAVAHAACELSNSGVAGAFLVAPADVEHATDWPVTNGLKFSKARGGFSPIPSAPFQFPSVVVASTNDPYCSRERVGEFALSWGSVLVEAGETGHINVDSGHGPWPEGLMRLGWFLKNLG